MIHSSLPFCQWLLPLWTAERNLSPRLETRLKAMMREKSDCGELMASALLQKRASP
jgi:hypothetical protein